MIIVSGFPRLCVKIRDSTPKKKALKISMFWFLMRFYHVPVVVHSESFYCWLFWCLWVLSYSCDFIRPYLNRTEVFSFPPLVHCMVLGVFFLILKRWGDLFCQVDEPASVCDLTALQVNFYISFPLDVFLLCLPFVVRVILEWLHSEDEFSCYEFSYCCYHMGVMIHVDVKNYLGHHDLLVFGFGVHCFIAS